MCLFALPRQVLLWLVLVNWLIQCDVNLNRWQFWGDPLLLCKPSINNYTFQIHETSVLLGLLMLSWFCDNVIVNCIMFLFWMYGNKTVQVKICHASFCCVCVRVCVFVCFIYSISVILLAYSPHHCFTGLCRASYFVSVPLWVGRALKTKNYPFAE